MFARTQRRSGRQVLVSTHSSDMLRDEGIGLDEVFLLLPGKEGTTVQPASANTEVKLLVDQEYSLADAVIPHTRPEQVHQLLLFDR
jgi:hypothetical protein